MAVIAKQAVRDFLNRPLNDTDWYKGLDEEDVDSLLRRVQFTAPHTPQLLHQKVASILGVKGSMPIFLDPGLGKTKVFLDLLRHFIVTGQVTRAIVHVPTVNNIEAWRREAKKHAPDLRFAGLDVAGRDARLAVVNGDSQVLVSTYVGWLALICKKNEGVDKQGNKLKGWKIDEKEATRLSKLFDMYGADESTALMNQDSMFSKAARRLRKYCHWRYFLTGTPFGKDPQAIWNQFELADNGETLGETLGMFRAAFCKEKLNYFSGWPTYEFDDSMAGDLNRIMRHKAIRYRDTECLDLPERVYSIQSVEFSDETWKYHDSIVEELKQARGNFKLLENVFNRMRQLASGFLMVKDPEGETVKVVFKENKKLDALLEKIEEIPDDRKILIFADFINSGQIVSDALKKNKIKHGWLYSGTKNKQDVQNRFIDDPSCRVLIGSQSVAYGLNFQVANYLLMYESPTSPIVREQVERRLYRMDQKRTVFITDFVVKNSIEEKILESIADGKDLFEEVVEGRASV